MVTSLPRVIGASCLATALWALTACTGGGNGAAEAVPTSAALDPTTTLAATTLAPTTTVIYAKVVFTESVSTGSRGDDVAYVQQRLQDLGFDPGPVDGQFGKSTAMAVWAYQKLIGLNGDDVDGRVTPELWSQMQDPLALTPMDPEPIKSRRLEIDLRRQVAILWEGGAPKLITHISTGNNLDWCENGWCGVAITPPGEYQFNRRVSGWRQSELGLLYNPVYFNGGIAVHGAEQVPLFPASHGCIRIPMHIADYFPSLVDKGDEVLVFDGIKSPREWGQVPPQANTVDPESTTTTIPLDTTIPGDTVVPGDTTIPGDAPVVTGPDGLPVEAGEDAAG